METVRHRGHKIVNTSRGEWCVFDDLPEAELGVPYYVADTLGDCVECIDAVLAETVDE